MLKVVKFGGSSLADSGQYKKVHNIISADKDRLVVVVSAAGKRGGDDHKITDLLYLCYAHIKYGVDATPVWNMIEERYLEIKKDLGLKTDIETSLAEIKSRLKKGISQDYLVSRGEYLSAILMADYLGYKFIDATDWISFGFDGEIEEKESYEKLRSIYGGGGVVIPGFYGAMPDGAIKVMSRGGSDITGALAAAALSADVYENWTDVPGVLMADPRIVKDPKPIAHITYDELRELSYMGASVLHEKTVYPVMEADIPLNIKDTNNPDHPGTMIMKQWDDVDGEEGFITGVTGKKDYSIVNMTKTGMSSAVGLFRAICEIFENHSIPIEYMPSGIDSLSVVVPSTVKAVSLYSVVGEIEKKIKPDSIDLTEHISVVAVVGRKMALRPGTSGKLFHALGENGINIRMISQGPIERNIIVGVDNNDYEKAVRVLYDNFIKE